MNKLQILVVEDDAPVRNLITTTLRAHEYKHIVAASGDEAIRQASTCNPDIMLLDLGPILHQPGGVVPFDLELDFSDMEFGGSCPAAEPVRAAAPGQSAVFYDGEDRVIGGGIIVRREGS